MPEIGLMGLGQMGVPICGNLVRAGYSVRAGDRRPEAAGQAAGCGALGPGPAQLAADVDVLVTVLPAPPRSGSRCSVPASRPRCAAGPRGST